MSYQGHKSWNAWNVSLWLYNDEGLYRIMCEHIRKSRTLDIAAERMQTDLHEAGMTHTLDGAPFTKTSIREAMRE